jgi:CubicO group peptidase (beta-lactamase class C family)
MARLRSRWIRGAALIVGLASLSSACAAPAIKRVDGTTISRAEVDRTVTRLMKAAQVTGVGIAVLNDGAVVYRKAYGWRDRARNLALTDSSAMWSGSLTKAAFAYLVMRLIDDGTLDLDRPVVEYLPKALPEYSAYRDLASDPRYRRITTRMLLSHTSGFPNLRFLNPDRTLTINFEPGSSYAYSGEGIELLQLVVESVTGRGLADHRERLRPVRRGRDPGTGTETDYP